MNNVIGIIALVVIVFLVACGEANDPEPEPEYDARTPACAILSAHGCPDGGSDSHRPE